MPRRTIAACLPAFLAGLCWSFCALPALAGEWFYRDWQADDGLPGDNVTGVVQTGDGFLWISTQAGLARFDGIEFESMSVPVGRERPIIRAMMLDEAGRIWLAEEGGVVVRMRGGEAQSWSWTNGLSRSQPLQLVQDAAGAVWIASADGTVCRIEEGGVTRFGAAEGLPEEGVGSLALDANKQLWFAKSGQVGVFRDGKFISQLSLNERTIYLQAMRGGGLWACTGARLLEIQSDGASREISLIPSSASLVRPTAVFEDSAGAVWIGTGSDGLFRWGGRTLEPIETSHQRIRTLTEDREGNIWVGTDGGGLNRLRQQVVEVQGRDAGLPFDTVRSTCEDNTGTLWVVTQNGDVVNNARGPWRTISSDPAWIGGMATCVTSDRQGAVWIGTLNRGLIRFQENKFSALKQAQGMAQASVRSLLADSQGRLWIAFATGDVLQCLSAGNFQNYDLPPESQAVRTLVEDAAGNIWMANREMRLLRVEGDKIVDEMARSSLPQHRIRCLAATADGTLWIGYSGVGLGRLQDGKFVLLGRDEGLKDDHICSLMPDKHGNMWFGSDRGIFRASLAELLAVQPGTDANVSCQSYGRDEGLPSLQCYFGFAPGATRTRDGRILIPTHSGLGIVHPGRIRANPLAPPVIIKRVALDSHPAELSAAGKLLQLPPDHHKVEFSFTAPSFIKPEKVCFRYKLEGWDEDWADANSSRIATYSRLPSGNYLFRVLACNSDGVWNETGATFAFLVRPFAWQTWWFRTATGLLLLAISYLAVRFVAVRRLRVKIQRLERENEVQVERARIARDIHDDLGARMTQISLLSELTRQSITQPDKAGNHVAQIATLSRQGIKSLDEIVWSVNPHNDSLADLLDYAGQYAVDFLSTAGVSCRIDFPERPPARELSGEVRHGLFLAVKETLNNVVKHAQATEVLMHVSTDESGLRWAISDNGRGFETRPDNALADGLRNLQKRLAGLGGRCEITSRAGAGTWVTIEIPWGAKNPP